MTLTRDPWSDFPYGSWRESESGVLVAAVMGADDFWLWRVGKMSGAADSREDAKSAAESILLQLDIVNQ